MSAIHQILGTGTKWILKSNQRPFFVNQLLSTSNVPSNSRNASVRILCMCKSLCSVHRSSFKDISSFETDATKAGVPKIASFLHTHSRSTSLVPPVLPDLNPESAVDEVHLESSPRKAFDEVVIEDSPEISSFIDDIGPLPPKRIFNLAAYMNLSESLQQLVKLGVDLSTIEERSRSEAEFIQSLDFENDMKNHIQFLHDVGVPADELGMFITKNPMIFREDLDNLKIKINYLEVKKFSKEQIARIVTKSPLHLSLETKTVDRRLGFLQKTFKLTGNEVRLLISKSPQLVPHYEKKLLESIFTIKELLGFSPVEMKQLLLKKPKLYRLSTKSLAKRFNVVHNMMGVPHEHICHFPTILLTREFIIEQRHKYLEKCGRAQYDPSKPNYVSLEDITTLKDGEFCRKCAKTSLLEFNEFLKTL